MRQLPTEGPCLSKSLMRKCIIPHTCHTGSVCDLWFHQIPLGKRFKHVDATWRQAGTSEMFWSIPNCFSRFFMSGDDQHQGESQDHRHLRYWRAPGEVERMQRANRHAYYSSPVGSEGLEDWFDLKTTLRRSPLTWCRRAWRITLRRRGHLKGERIAIRPWSTWTREGFINIPLTKLRWFCETK